MIIFTSPKTYPYPSFDSTYKSSREQQSAQLSTSPPAQPIFPFCVHWTSSRSPPVPLFLLPLYCRVPLYTLLPFVCLGLSLFVFCRFQLIFIVKLHLILKVTQCSLRIFEICMCFIKLQIVFLLIPLSESWVQWYFKAPTIGSLSNLLSWAPVREGRRDAT